MMVTFVSQCGKKALNRSRRVLDAFADRIGDNTWQTVITQEGLLAVKKLLRKTASKNTAVSCHWIRSRSRSELVWVVGKREKFNLEGVMPVNLTSENKQSNEQFVFNTKVIAWLSSLAGLFHDVGKSNDLFQAKLAIEGGKAQKGYEPYRHEWVSLRIFQAFVGTKTDKEWLNDLVEIDNQAESKILEMLTFTSLKDGISTNTDSSFKGLPPVAQLFAWLIVSHHKLPQFPKMESSPPVILPFLTDIKSRG